MVPSPPDIAKETSGWAVRGPALFALETRLADAPAPTAPPRLDALTAIVEPEARALGFAVVRVMMIGGADEPTLQVMAERPDTGQLTIDDCADLSRRLSDRFDALEAEGRDPFDHAYRLEVSSPGIDRPLTRLQDFAEWAGHEAKVALVDGQDGRKQFTGTLDGVEGDIILMTDRQERRHRLAFADLQSAKLTLTDRLIAATQPLSADGADEIETQED